MIDFKKIDKQFKIVEELRKLDASIIEIDKAAKNLTNSECKINFSIQVTDEKLKQEMESKKTINSFGDDSEFIGRAYPGGIFRDMVWKIYNDRETEIFTQILTNELDANESLTLLASLLRVKQIKRKTLLQKLHDLERDAV